MSSLPGLDDLDLTRLPDDSEVRVTRSSPRKKAGPVAIIGMSGRVGEAEDLDGFFASLLRGEEGYRDLSAERRADVDAYLAARGVRLPIAAERYSGGARLPSVSEFDYRFFSLSRQEAKSIDPNQRIFLETAWAALEDAGYLNKDIGGGKVGVYAGMSADFGEDYRAVVQAIDPGAPEIAVAGNIRSMIASRIAYLLDLRGPSLLVDTACSSGLVAAYTAYRAIQHGECSMAIVGAVKTDLLPVDADDESGIGIKDIQDTLSADRRTRTFDRRGDGTSTAEGCVVLVLKSLDRAQRDGDHVHAVIMGGAVNQDGASNGITAPNADAQADLITDALADAGVRAEQISFIEAHGTATRLGDPVEVSGIDRAFSRQTARKQFCGIGTVKTNIGHMDNASGLVGLAKLVLSLKHRVLPASLNFQEPNRNIAFAQTPVYVNDRTVPWSDDEREALYAGINSFGLSGTNCHLVLRGPDAVPVRDRAGAQSPTCFLLPLSARDGRALARLAERYRAFLADHEVDLADLAFTASVGRLHHGVRAAFVFESRAELDALLARYIEDVDGVAANPDVGRGSFRLVLDAGEKREPHDLTHAEREELDREAAAVASPTADRAALRRLASLYARGAEVDWRRAAPGGARRTPLPTYPFERSRCWVEPAGQGRRGLIDGAEVVRSLDRDIVVCRLDPEHFWELAEHRIHGVGVLPGTGLVEMVVSAARRLGLAGSDVVLRDVLFAAPLAVADGEVKEVHLIFETRGDVTAVTIAGRGADGGWVENARAELVRGAVADAVPPLDVEGLRRRLDHPLREPEGSDHAKGLDVSDRWTGALGDGHADAGAAELLYEFELPSRYRSELADYVLHPSLFDTVINAPSNVYDQERLYLPFSYGVLTIRDSLPARVLAHFRKRPESVAGALHAFDVTVVDPSGRVLLTVDNYCVKSAVDLDVRGAGEHGYVQAYRLVAPPAPTRGGGGTVLLCGDFGAAFDGVRGELASAGYDCVLLPDAGDADERLGGRREFAFGVLACLPAGDASLADATSEPVRRALGLIELISDRQLVFAGGLLALTHNALAVTGDETALHPGQAGLLGLMRVAALEYKALGIRCVDSDERTGPAALAAEAAGADRPPFLLYRDGRPHEPHVKRHPVPARDGGRALPPGDGVTLVSGGTGDLGTAVARHLVSRGVRKLVLLGSDHADATRPDWAEFERDLDVFEVVRLDLGDGQAVDRAVRELRERHGRISGVLHLAGRPGVGFLYTKDFDEFMRVYRPKALGAVHLHEATLADRPDYFVAFSSIAGLLLDQGQTDYTAANLVLDSLAQRRDREGLPGLSVQWPAWRETGIAERMGAADEDELFPPLDTAEAVDLLDALMASGDTVPVLMPGRMRKPARQAPREAGRGSGGRAVRLHGLDSVGDLERGVAEIWAEALDLDVLDAHEEFGDLGGNSLLTAQVLKLYDERYPGLMDITDLFRCTTVAAQAACLAAKSRVDAPAAASPPPAAAKADEGDIDKLLDLLEQGAITVEDRQGLLEETDTRWTA
ncbi:SDR family NAD(P)-dependent oxidoreductase [Saccharothrix sp. 6-C]|uniref:type I polyketide synthase n=1 Tax=Saccharothrix sp. 6-C TaxID=2781735 RepID=UPI001916F0E2|nr:type I polyketide synthase [Saccharothrix sp. 6-C]QQQ73925.1 SDR family NAD(P)-dependent oxidoreductase [Saccharothrix sp. 6-C]